MSDDMPVTGYEIDFFPVGDGTRSGDAIVVRWGDLYGPRESQKVAVVDGGFTDDGEAIVSHVKDTVGTSTVDLVISTHPDQDHISGLTTVVEELEVGALCMHLPWDHTTDIAELFHDGRVTDNSVSQKLRDELNGARILAEAALEMDVPIVEPFTGMTGFGGVLTIVGPTQEYYEALLPEFRCTPEPSRLGGLSKTLGAVRSIGETFGFETLSDSGETSAENSTSVITLWTFDGRHCLLTGDAGIEALHRAADELEAMDCAPPYRFVQVPHHGSRRNVGPAVLDRILGPRLAAEETLTTAFASAAAGAGPKHPARAVTNAFLRRGAPVITTKDYGRLCHSHNAPSRPGWVTANPLPLFPDVEV